jgi:hypothetical protein
MNDEQPPEGLGIRERVKWFMDRDATTIRDAHNFKARFGDWPVNTSKRRIRKDSPAPQ